MKYLEEVRQILVSEFELAPEDVTLDATLVEDLDIDSIDAVDLLVQLKENTGVHVPTENLKELRTVGDVIQLLEAL